MRRCNQYFRPGDYGCPGGHYRCRYYGGCHNCRCRHDGGCYYGGQRDNGGCYYGGQRNNGCRYYGCYNCRCHCRYRDYRRRY